MKSVAPSPAVVAFVEDLKATLGRHVELTPVEILAAASHFVGTLIALQDQRHVTPRIALDIVQSNLQAGNADAISSLLDTAGRA